MRNLLGNHRLFAALDPAALDLLAQHAQVLRLGVGDSIATAQDQFYAVAHGHMQNGELRLRAGDALMARHAIATSPALIVQLPAHLAPPVEPHPIPHKSAKTVRYAWAWPGMDAVVLQQLNVVLGVIPWLVATPWVDLGLLYNDPAWTMLLGAAIAICLVLQGVVYRLHQRIVQPAYAQAASVWTWRRLAQTLVRAGHPDGPAVAAIDTHTVWKMAARLPQRAAHLLRDFLAIPTCGALLVWVQPQLGTLSVTAAIVSGAIWLGVTWRQPAREAQARTKRAAALAHRWAHGVAPMQPITQQRQSALQQQALAAERFAADGRIAGELRLQGLRQLLLLGFFALAVQRVAHQKMTAGELVTGVGLYAGALAAATRLLPRRRGIPRPPSPHPRTGPPKDRPRWRGELQLNRVSVFAGPAQPLLVDVSLHLPAGSSIGIVGASGCGKSTLARLLGGHLEPDNGTLTAQAGVLLPASTLRMDVAVVGNQPFFVAGTLRDNVVLPDTTLAQATLTWAAHVTDLQPTLWGRGWETAIAARGQNLSALWRLRVALTRALARRPKVLVLDDALWMLTPSEATCLVRHLQQALVDCTLVVLTCEVKSVQGLTRQAALCQGTLCSLGETF